MLCYGLFLNLKSLKYMLLYVEPTASSVYSSTPEKQISYLNSADCIWLRLCNNRPSNMQCEAVEHWGDIKSDFVPLGIPTVLMSCLEICQAAQSWETRVRRGNVILLHHKLHCEEQSSMSSMTRALFKQCWTALVFFSLSFLI